MTSDRPRRAANREVWRRLHRWLGLGIGLLLLVVALTGAVLLWKPQLLRWHYPALAEATAQASDVTRMLTLADQHYSGWRLLRLPQTEQPYFVLLRGEQQWLFDGDGSLLVTRSPTSDWLAVLEDLHHHLLVGDAGDWLLGVVALLSLLMLAIGLWLAWPAASRWREALTVSWRAGGLRRHFSLHRAGGVFGALLFFWVTFTGLMMTMNGWPAKLFPSFDAQPPPVVVDRLAAPVQTMLPWPILLQHAQAALPDGVMTLISPPTAADKPLRIRMRQPDEWHPNGRGGVTLHPGTGEVILAMDVRQAGAGSHVGYTMYPLHAGKVGGLGYQLLLAVAAGLLLVLAWTGVAIWWRRH